MHVGFHNAVQEKSKRNFEQYNAVWLMDAAENITVTLPLK